MALKTLTNITDAQLKAYGVSALATRPNAPSTYGEGGLSAEELKARFDNLGKMLAKAINDINTALNTDGASYISVEIGEEIKSLADLSSSYLDGTFANVLKAYEKATDIGDTEKLKTLQAILSGFSQRIAEVETAGDVATLEQAKAYADTQDTTNLATAKNYADTQDTTNLANAKAYADTKIAELIDSAPATFDTLKEIADWIESGHYGQGASLRNMGAWATATSYSANAEYIDIAVYENTAYLCKLSHTSSESILPTNTTYWEMISNGVVSATISGMDITFTFADGTTQTLEIQTETAEATEITIDSTPTNNSTNLVTSGGVKTALDGMGMAVKYNEAQSLTELEKAQARTNIDVYSTSEVYTKSETSRTITSVTQLGLTYPCSAIAILNALISQNAYNAEVRICLSSATETVTGLPSNFGLLIIKTPPDLTMLRLIVEFTSELGNGATKRYLGKITRSGNTVTALVFDEFATKQMPLLWEGGFTSGSITVAGISNYKMIVVKVAASSASFPVMRSSGGGLFVGGGIYSGISSNVTTYAVNMSVDGDTVTYGTYSSIIHTIGETHTGGSGVAITRIWGVI